MSRQISELSMTQPRDEDRSRWMGVLAKASPGEIAAAWERLPEKPAYGFLRKPETGLVMVRGRMGGDGSPFNLGEMTVTRCSVRLGDGTVGHAYIAGRDRAHAERAAVLDALMLQAARRPSIEDGVIGPLSRAQGERREAASRKAAATKVDFFTLVRGEG
jgi:alpha-D-ribose 1-methylphosphonate 5-triphosphate synthase subunit PhnG